MMVFPLALYIHSPGYRQIRKEYKKSFSSAAFLSEVDLPEFKLNIAFLNLSLSLFLWVVLFPNFLLIF